LDIQTIELAPQFGNELLRLRVVAFELRRPFRLYVEQMIEILQGLCFYRSQNIYGTNRGSLRLLRCQPLFTVPAYGEEPCCRN